MKKIRMLKKTIPLAVLLVLSFTQKTSAQKLSDAINDAIKWVQAPPCGNICMAVANVNFSIQNGASLITSDGAAMMLLETKSYTLGGITTKVNFVATPSNRNKYHIFNTLTRTFTENDNFTYAAASNNSLIRNADLLPELFSIVYKNANGTLTTVSLNNAATVEKSGTSIVTYKITQSVGGRRVILRITLEYYLAG